eukprot:NODE_5977_length_619_cov_15.138596_g5574_i0.p1 GENE.NODE_5977_length_619_cov_15.138596_g5574_i0~~NODE_5977_length_619_cov_15.138596_g5574_i0.p1  ORF type:complete len:107 (-),score=8.21 NODE_5977_length_619_cov_15.138596_g5574_i0:198-518(-)
MTLDPRLVAGGLLVLSGVTHTLQLLIYKQKHLVPAFVFGLFYLATGLAILSTTTESALWFGATVPAVGTTLGLLKYIRTGQRTMFTEFHLLVGTAAACLNGYLLSI